MIALISLLIVAGSFAAVALVRMGAPECDYHEHVRQAEKLIEPVSVVSLKDVGAL